ncbi:outer membrane beta-barrel protein [Polluticoccus soli]|uniref:outer membrane beta-barrel protein n=1 Tax=Polluticoccus soli TaxID=3034150 RepID=UPI0023E1181A|nr:outer membrane beta-barrel protein [Flavipsychrobacter sp. JY13-12]
MRCFLLAIIMIAGIMGTKAQRVNFGAEAGLSLSSMAIRHQGEQVKAGMTPGLKAGVIGDVRFNDMFSVQPGLYFNQKGYTDNGIKTTLPYAELPVNFQFRFPAWHGHFFTGGGPYAAYLLNDKNIAFENQHIENTISNVKPFDMGININGGYLLRGSAFIRANAGFGFMNLNGNGNTENALRNCSLSFTLGYMLSQ